MTSPRLLRSALFITLSLAAMAAPKPSGLDLGGFDRSVRVQDDLFTAVNGSWLRNTPIPADQQAAWGVDAPAVARQRIRSIVDQLSLGKHRPGSVGQQVGDFYASFIDTASLDRAGLAPIAPLLSDIDGIDSVAALAKWQGRMQGIIETPIFLQFVLPDFKDPGINRPYSGQGGLGLPGRDYYLDTSKPEFAKARDAYLHYLTTLAGLAGDKNPADAAKRVLALETRISALQVAPEDARDPGKMYNPMSATALQQQAPGFDWPAFATAAGLSADDTLVITTPATAAAIAKLYGELPLADWKLYFKLRSLDEAAAVLPDAVRKASFAFNGTALTGVSSPKPRNEQGIALLNTLLGEPLGKLYVERYFPSAHKAQVKAMVGNILAASRALIGQTPWMSAPTRQQALDKLSKYQVKIGYPDTWRDFGALQIKAGDALGNLHRAKRFEWLYQAGKVGKAVQRSDWMMTPQTVDAYYDPTVNAINFPAGFLQAPIFNPTADDAYNYGALGTQIGHEISHGFDNLGNQFDGDGAMRNWWQDADRQAFDAIASKLVEQFNRYEALPGKNIDGKRTLPENLADLAGVQIAFKAYQMSLAGKPSPVIGGYTGEQRFFLAYAQSKRSKLRDELMLDLLSNDVHAPQAFRCNGPVSNSDAFHQAFATRPGDGLYRPAAQRIRLW